MDTILQWLTDISDVAWGWPTIILLVGTGFFLTYLLRAIQFRELAHSLWLAFIKRKEVGAEGDISHFQALMTALAATVGVGNIAGVGTAIALGGPGALCWMWVTGLVGMATKYSEALLGVRYRVEDARGDMAGGPMYYLSRGISGRKGKILGFLFALFAAVAAFGIGDMVQSNSVADALQAQFGTPPIWTGIVLAVLAALVILGGIRSIGRFTGFFVPFMVVLYILGGLTVLGINWASLDEMIRLVFAEAISPTAATGGFAGATLRAAIRFGFERGVFSNESGLGTGGIAAAAAQTEVPASQALVSMTQTFIDTIIVCSITGLTIVATGAWARVDPSTGAGYTGAELTAAAFSIGLPGEWGGIVVALGLAFFAFSTLLGWAYYGEKAIEYLLDERAIIPYRILFLLGAFFGAYVLEFGEVVGLELVWTFAAIFNAAMAWPNLVGLLLLSGVVASETRAFIKGREAPAEPEAPAPTVAD